MGKVLFIARAIEGVNTGAHVITQRNLVLLQQQFGEKNVDCYWINQKVSRVQQFLNILRLNLSGLSSSHLSQIKEMLKSGNYTEAFIDNSLLAKLSLYIKQHSPQITVKQFFHNVEYDYFLRLLFSSLKLWHILSIVAIRYNEKVGSKYADELIFLNKRDARRIFTLYNLPFNKPYRIFPTSMVDRYEALQINNNSHNSKLQILFVGTYFFSNYHGIKWFVDKVFPFINAELTIVGRGFEAVAQKFTHANINVVGTVEDLAPYYYKSDVVIAPIFKGSGMKTKLAEAFMFGKQIIATKEAFEGYEIDINSVGYICNSDKEFIETINNNTFTKFNQSSRDTFLKYYDSKSNIQRYEQNLFTSPPISNFVFAELARTGLVHTEINASVVSVFKKYYNVSTATFWGEHEHLNTLKDLKLEKHCFTVVSNQASIKIFKKVKLVLREVRFILIWFQLLIKSKRKPIDVLVITSALPIVHLIIKYTLKLLNKHTQVFLVLHGEVENIFLHPNSYYNILQSAINYPNKINDRFKYIALSHTIRLNLLNTFKLKDKDVLAITHPGNFSSDKLNKKVSTGKIIFASIGVHSTFIKQSHLIFELAQSFSNEIDAGKVEFQIIGKLEEDIMPYCNNYVKIISNNNGMLDKNTFNQSISSVNYLLFFAPSGVYRFTASGTIMDALKYQIPIIGLRNESLNDLCVKAEKIGYIADDLSAMKDFIWKLIQHNDSDEYNLMCENLYKAQRFYSIDNAVEELKNQL